MRIIRNYGIPLYGLPVSALDYRMRIILIWSEYRRGSLISEKPLNSVNSEPSLSSGDLGVSRLGKDGRTLLSTLRQGSVHCSNDRWPPDALLRISAGTGSLDLSYFVFGLFKALRAAGGVPILFHSPRAEKLTTTEKLLLNAVHASQRGELGQLAGICLQLAGGREPALKIARFIEAIAFAFTSTKLSIYDDEASDMRQHVSLPIDPWRAHRVTTSG